MEKTKGFVCVTIAAIIFGFTPILAKLTYLGGNNTIMMVFVRNVFALPVIWLILKYLKISLKTDIELLKKMFIYSILSSSGTALLLYGSYNYIPVGMATTIHYVYPMLIALISVLFFKEKLGVTKISALILSFIGILLFFDGESSLNILGITISLASGVTYGIALIYIDKSGLKEYEPFFVSFYTCLFSGIVTFLATIFTNTLTFSLTGEAWLYAFIISMFTSVIAITFMQIGVKRIGPITTSILCTFEPITGVILGILILNEPISVKIILGCIFIIVAVVILSIMDSTKKESTS